MKISDEDLKRPFVELSKIRLRPMIRSYRLLLPFSIRKGAGSQQGLLGSTEFRVYPPGRPSFARPISRRVFT